MRRGVGVLLSFLFLAFCYLPKDLKDWKKCTFEAVVVRPDTPPPTRFFRGKVYLCDVDAPLKRGEVEKVLTDGRRFVGFSGILVSKGVPVESLREVKRRGYEVILRTELGNLEKVEEVYDGVLIGVPFGEVKKGKYAPPDVERVIEALCGARRRVKGKLWVLFRFPRGVGGERGRWREVADALGAVLADDWSVEEGGVGGRRVFNLGERESFEVGKGWVCGFFERGVLCVGRRGARLTFNSGGFSHLCDEESGECLVPWNGVYSFTLRGEREWLVKVLEGEREEEKKGGEERW